MADDQTTEQPPKAKGADEEANANAAEPSTSTAETTDEKAESAPPADKSEDATAEDEKKSEETSEPAAAEETKDEPMEDAKEDAANDDEAEEETPAEPKPDAPSGRGRRVRKSTQFLEPEEEKKKETVIPEGKGEKLEDMPRVVANFKDVTWSDLNLKALHSIVFGPGKKKEFKKHLLAFNGLVYPKGKEEQEAEKIRQKMYKLKLPELKAVMDLADVNRSADSFEDTKNPDKDALCERFMEWLEKPTASEKKVSSGKKAPAKKRKSTDSAKKEGKTSSAKKTKKVTPAKKTAPKKKKATKKPSKDTGDDGDDGEIELNIPGVDIEKVRAKVKSIVESANKEELTVKGVRKMLEDWLDTDLKDHKDAVRSIVMEAM